MYKGKTNCKYYVSMVIYEQPKGKKMINILMAVYNGGAYIEKQIRSILEQTYADWRLYIRDDGSSDNTQEIISNIARNFPNKIIILKSDGNKNLGVKGNFSYLLEYCDDADFYCFCDQDDIWEKNKLEEMLKAIRAEELDQPMLVYHDMCIIDERDCVISPSLYEYSGINLSSKHPFEQLLTHNTISGCALMINRKLKNIIKRIPDECIIHDWWIVLSTFVVGGKVIHVDKLLSHYRIHGFNQVGVRKKISFKWVLHALMTKRYLLYAENNRAYKGMLCGQVELLFSFYEGNVVEDAAQSMKQFVRIVTSRRRIVSLLCAYKYGYVLAGRLETVKFYLL